MNDVIVLDGPTGTELQRLGYRTSLPLWSASANLDAPELVRQIHFSYLNSGCDVLTANTFRTNSRTFKKVGLGADTAREFTYKGVELAQQALLQSQRTGVKVAGSIAPVEDCYSPDLVPSDEELLEEHSTMAEWLRSAGVEIILVETMNKLREGKIASIAAIESGLPVWSSFVLDNSGESIIDGEPIERIVEEIGTLDVEAILLNCSSNSSIERGIERLAMLGIDANFKIGGYANSGVPDDEQGWSLVRTTPESELEKSAERMIRLGATIIGGCCGTTPLLIKNLVKLRDRSCD